jgi:hypothetical protein
MTKQGYSAHRKFSLSLWMKYSPSSINPETTVQTIAIFGGVDQNGIPDVTTNSRFIQWQIQA